MSRRNHYDRMYLMYAYPVLYSNLLFGVSLTSWQLLRMLMPGFKWLVLDFPSIGGTFSTRYGTRNVLRLQVPNDRQYNFFDVSISAKPF